MREALGSLARICYGKSPAEVLSVDGEVPVIGTGGIYASATRALYERGVIVARKGSLGTPHLMKRPFWPSDTTFALLPNNGVDLDWLYFNLLNFDLTKLNEATGVPSIGREWLAKVKFLRLEQPEQQRIAAILTSLDNAIEATEALIEKHQQIKAGLMHDLFTRGVLPNGELRPSPHEEPSLYAQSPLGVIPVDWRVTTCEEVCECVIDCKNRTPPETPDGYPVVRTPNVRNGEFVDGDLLFTDAKSYAIWTARGKPLAGDILITREAPVGEVCMIPERHAQACLGQRMMLYRPDQKKIDSTFFLFALQSRAIQNRLDLISGGSTVGHVRVGDIRSLWMYRPQSMVEQRLIADALKGIATQLRTNLDQLDKLRQLKLGLMQDLLTGKVHVPMPEAETAAA